MQISLIPCLKRSIHSVSVIMVSRVHLLLLQSWEQAYDAREVLNVKWTLQQPKCRSGSMAIPVKVGHPRVYPGLHTVSP